MAQQTQYKITKSGAAQAVLFAQSAINRLLNFLGLRRTKQFWGIVYDSVSKQPLDPVLVKLLYVDGREAETCVTDLNGGYGFLARPGQFKIFPRRSNYVFPSRIPGPHDGIYKNIYKGEFFTLVRDFEVVAPNIPMDPEKADWNQEAKKQIIKKDASGELLIKRVVAVGFWLILPLLIAGIWRAYPLVPSYAWLMAGCYVVLIVFSKIIPETRLNGRVISLNQNLNPQSLFLELHNPKFDQVTFGKAQVREDGKFLLRGGKGKYVLKIFKTNSGNSKELLGDLPVVIGRAGIVNSTIYIK